MPPLRLSDEAEEELWREADLLEGERPGWGHRFVELVYETIELLNERPHIAKAVPNTPAEFRVRRLVLKRFPLSLVTAEIDGVPTVIAIAPARKRPLYWLDRVE